MAEYLDNLDHKKIYEHYNRPEILNELVRLSQNKEVVGSFGGKGYAKRPDAIFYASDILALVKKGITSFHFSEETWNDPLKLVTGMQRKDQDNLRIGWDLILDIDCVFFEYSKLAANLIVQALQHYGIKSISVKFSGNHGFHIAVPFEAMPEYIDGKQTKNLFPEAPRVIAALLKEKIEPQSERGKLSQAIIEYEKQQMQASEKLLEEELTAKVIEKIQEKTGFTFDQLTRKSKDAYGNTVHEFNAFQILTIDTILISSRHLLRMTYSVNEKSGMVSIPINPLKIIEFDRNLAKLENMTVSRFKFLDRENAIAGEATKLFREAYDKTSSKSSIVLSDEQQSGKKQKYDEALDQEIPEQFFPEVITTLLQGNLKDGRKRAVFLLAAFLVNVGWSKEHVEERLAAWNKTHPDQLKDSYVRGQINHVWSAKTMPPNFVTIAEYFGYDKASLPARYKNPVAYAKSKFKIVQKQQDAKRETLTDEQKALRKEHRKRMKAKEQLS